VNVVFDTNILASGIVFPRGALQRLIEEHDQLILSEPILEELLGVLARIFFRATPTSPPT
jgi:predicted nucleic acid-binding protein